jgi:hypothetical protein
MKFTRPLLPSSLRGKRRGKEEEEEKKKGNRALASLATANATGGIFCFPNATTIELIAQAKKKKKEPALSHLVPPTTLCKIK